MGRKYGEAGRRAEWCTFVLISMVEKALAKSKGKLYVAFVDVRKAYDSVNRNILWDVFCQSGSRLYDRRVLLPSRAQAGRV